MAHDTPIVERCRARTYATAEPLLRRAQEAGAARTDVSANDVLRMYSGIGLLQAGYPGQLEIVAAVALDGVRRSYPKPIVATEPALADGRSPRR